MGPRRGPGYDEAYMDSNDDDEKSSPEDPDRELVDRARTGDRSAFNELVRRHQVGLTALCRRYVKNDDDARDLAQRALLKAFENLASFRGEAAFRTWVYRIGVHLALNHLRVREHVEISEIDDVAAFTSSLSTGKLVAKELWRKVQASIGDLPAKQRLVLELRVFHDLTFKEIAPLAGCTEDSAKVNYHHAVKRIRHLVKPG